MNHDEVTNGAQDNSLPSGPIAQNQNSNDAAAAHIAQAEAEDVMDAAWRAECEKTRVRFVAEHPELSEAEATFMSIMEFPPQPKGCYDRIMQCNRCGQKTERHPDHDAYFCRRCNRWTSAGCGEPKCVYCGERPARPLP